MWVHACYAEIGQWIIPIQRKSALYRWCYCHLKYVFSISSLFIAVVCLHGQSLYWYKNINTHLSLCIKLPLYSTSFCGFWYNNSTRTIKVHKGRVSLFTFTYYSVLIYFNHHIPSLQLHRLCIYVTLVLVLFSDPVILTQIMTDLSYKHELSKHNMLKSLQWLYQTD